MRVVSREVVTVGLGQMHVHCDALLCGRISSPTPPSFCVFVEEPDDLNQLDSVSAAVAVAQHAALNWTRSVWDLPHTAPFVRDLSTTVLSTVVTPRVIHTGMKHIRTLLDRSLPAVSERARAAPLLQTLLILAQFLLDICSVIS